MNETELAIELKHVSKKFRIYHERKNSLYEYIVSFFNRNNSYEELTVLDDISLTVRKGEMIGILGFNGSGKTTLLKLIAKIYYPNNGTVTTYGKLTPFLELGTGFNSELTAKDNIILYGILLGFTKNEIMKKINTIIKFAELEKFLDTKLKNFSSGMYARLAFSTAISVNPDILLVDEILSVGDIKFQEKSYSTLLDFKKQKKTIVFVSHNINEIEKHCDSVIWIHNGKIIQHGDATTVTKKYKEFALENKIT